MTREVCASHRMWEMGSGEMSWGGEAVGDLKSCCCAGNQLRSRGRVLQLVNKITARRNGTCARLQDHQANHHSRLW
jgi:hypothetical protein